MARQEILIAQLGAQSFDQGNEVMGNVMNSSLHPHANGGTAEHVQAKSFIDSMLQLSQREWGQGVGDTMLGSIRSGIIHAAEHGDLVGARVPDLQRYFGAMREIPMAARRQQGDPRPGLLMAGGDAQTDSGRGCGCLGVGCCELRDPGLFGEIKQQEFCGQRLDGRGGQPERGGGPAAARFHDDLDVSRQGGDGKR